MNAWASGLLVVALNGTSPMPGSRTARRRGPSLNDSPWIECPAAGTAGFVSVADADGFVGSSAAAYAGACHDHSEPAATVAANQRGNLRIVFSGCVGEGNAARTR